MVGTSIVYSDAGATLQRAALTGDVTASQDSNATLIATPGSVTVATDDKVLIKDTSASDVTKYVTAQNIRDILLVKGNGTEASNAVTASGLAGVITTSSLSTGAGGTYAITWTNTSIAATSVINLTWMGGTNTKDIIFKVVPGPGSATLTIYNIDLLAALDGTVIIGYLVS